MSGDRKLLYTIIVIINREGESQIVPYKEGEEEEAEKFFDKASQNWSDSYFCRVEKGPVV